MNIRSSNRENDTILLSCGGDDDSRLIVWDSVERLILNEATYASNSSKSGIYNLNLITFDDLNKSNISRNKKKQGTLDNYLSAINAAAPQLALNQIPVSKKVTSQIGNQVNGSTTANGTNGTGTAIMQPGVGLVNPSAVMDDDFNRSTCSRSNN